MLGLYPERSYDFELEASKLVELSDRLRKKFSITVAVADNWYEDNGFWFLPLGEALPPNSNAATLSFLMEMLDDAKGRHEAERARIRLADAHFGLPEQPLSTSAADDNDIEF